MNTKHFILTAFAVAALTTAAVYSQGIVIAHLKHPPPFGFKLEKMWQVTLNNATQQTYNVYLRGVATENSEGFIADAITGTFTLPPGVKVVNTARNYDLTNVSINKCTNFSLVLI